MSLYQSWYLNPDKQNLLFGFKAKCNDMSEYDMQTYGFVPNPQNDTGTLFIDSIGCIDLHMSALVYINPLKQQLFLSGIEINRDGKKGARRLLKRSLPRYELEQWVKAFFGPGWHMHLGINLTKERQKVERMINYKCMSVIPNDIITSIAKIAVKWDGAFKSDISFFQYIMNITSPEPVSLLI
jgi:hypothetical protein